MNQEGKGLEEGGIMMAEVQKAELGMKLGKVLAMMR